MTLKISKEILLLYIPVIHRGYLNLFHEYKHVDELWIISSETAKKILPERIETESLDGQSVWEIILKANLFKCVFCVDETDEKIFASKDISIISTDDTVSRKFVEKFLPDVAKITYDTSFLHWDENKIHAPTNVRYDRISTDSFDREMMKLAKIEGDRSSDWWRHVGVVLVKDGKPLFQTHNTHLPSEYTPYILGDPRDFVKSGTNPEICGAIHAEKLMICLAAKNGISTDGCDIYLTTFPCIPCAQAVACAGIKRVFYGSGNAYLNTDEVLKSAGVEIILVQ